MVMVGPVGRIRCGLGFDYGTRLLPLRSLRQLGFLGKSWKSTMSWQSCRKAVDFEEKIMKRRLKCRTVRACVTTLAGSMVTHGVTTCQHRTHEARRLRGEAVALTPNLRGL
jgi:hypothetical protein